MKIVMIGAGNLAVHLSKALWGAGFDIIQVYSRSEKSAEALAGSLESRYTTSISDIDTRAALYIMAVSDDAIPELIKQLPLAEQLVVHTAGSVSMGVFSGKLQNYGVLYPLQTFSKARPVDFGKIPIFLEANKAENLHKIREIAERISGELHEASSERRLFLHLSAVFGCNFVNCLYGLAVQMVQQVGFDFDVLSPLILETARKAIASGDPKVVQTGPAIRNDRKVMDKHIELLSEMPEWRDLYIQMSNYIGQQCR